MNRSSRRDSSCPLYSSYFNHLTPADILAQPSQLPASPVESLHVAALSKHYAKAATTRHRSLDRTIRAQAAQKKLGPAANLAGTYKDDDYEKNKGPNHCMDNDSGAVGFDVRRLDV